MEKPRILIVDDEDDVVRALQFRLETAGYEALIASNGAEALSTLQDKRVDLILTDFMMPEVNGLELARLIKENPNWRHLKIVLFSCHTQPELQEAAVDLGALDYLSKTEGASSIVQRIYGFLGHNLSSHAPDRSESSTGAVGHPVSRQLRSLSAAMADLAADVHLESSLLLANEEALDSVQSLADDLHRLAISVDAACQPADKPSLPV